MNAPYVMIRRMRKVTLTPIIVLMKAKILTPALVLVARLIQKITTIAKLSPLVKQLTGMNAPYVMIRKMRLLTTTTQQIATILTTGQSALVVTKPRRLLTFTIRPLLTKLTRQLMLLV